jgi:hypothetical protein
MHNPISHATLFALERPLSADIVDLVCRWSALAGVNRAFAVRHLQSKVGILPPADRFSKSQRSAAHGMGARFFFVAKGNASTIRHRFTI